MAARVHYLNDTGKTVRQGRRLDTILAHGEVRLAQVMPGRNGSGILMVEFATPAIGPTDVVSAYAAADHGVLCGWLHNRDEWAGRRQIGVDGSEF